MEQSSNKIIQQEQQKTVKRIKQLLRLINGGNNEKQIEDKKNIEEINEYTHQLSQFIYSAQCVRGEQETIKASDILLLSQYNWSNITCISLNSINFHNIGCKYLTKMNCIKLQFLWLCQAQIEYEGIKHLVKGDWKQLKFINLNSNYIKGNFLKCLSFGNWKNMKEINIQQSSLTFVKGNITFEEAKKLLLYVQNIQNIHMTFNKENLRVLKFLNKKYTKFSKLNREQIEIWNQEIY